MVSLIRSIFRFLGWLCSPLYSRKVGYVWYLCRREFITQLNRRDFASFGRGSLVGLNVRLIKPQYIRVGAHSSICSYCELSCSEVADNTPQLIIGNGVSIGERAHISCANRVIIGNGVLTGKGVLITDNAHGASLHSELDTPPMARSVVSSGAVIIEDNVWIGDKASIMPNVTIGRGSVVAANAVVTKDVPPYCVVAGVPAKVVKNMFSC